MSKLVQWRNFWGRKTVSENTLPFNTLPFSDVCSAHPFLLSHSPDQIRSFIQLPPQQRHPQPPALFYCLERRYLEPGKGDGSLQVIEPG